MKIFYNILSALLISSFCFSCTAQSKTNLNAEEFEKAITQTDIQLLDVRLLVNTKPAILLIHYWLTGN